MSEATSAATVSASAVSDVDDLDFDKAWEQLSWKPAVEEATVRDTYPSPTHPSPAKTLSSNATRKQSRSPMKSHHRERRASWRSNVDKENHQHACAATSKSMGISPANFYHKRVSESRDPHRQQESSLKETIERNLLVQEKKEHQSQLEGQRKAFRQSTTLKIWPLQDMAMDHLDYLKDDGTTRSSQFHGGEYLSSESGSSTGSAAAVQPRRRTNPSPSKDNGSMPTSLSKPSTIINAVDENEPLWSREPRIFATEKAQGKRKYLVGHFGRIADWYWRKCVSKHLYEVIRQDTPCRMYFDLEYSKKFNPSVDDEVLLKEFRQELAADFLEHCQITLETQHIIDLDSTTEVKFSRHWMLDLDHLGLFEDAPTVGRFIKRLVGRLAEELATNQLEGRRPTLAKHLFVKTKDEQKPSCFIDLGVYTRNRLFRCFGSSKFGKSNTLQIAEANGYPMEALPALASSIAGPDTDNSPTNGSTSTSIQRYIVANDWRAHARALAATLVVPLGGSEGKRIFRVDEDEATAAARLSHGSNNTGRVFHPAVPIRMAKAPSPSLDRYILEVLGCRGGAPGAIRAWSMEYGGQRGDIPVSITYQLCRNRYCELVGRAHKSNNIFWTIIFDGWTCIQGCHDPECFGRGSPVPIRADRLPAIRAQFETWKEKEFEKALLALNLDDITSSLNLDDITSSGDIATSEVTNKSGSIAVSTLAEQTDRGCDGQAETEASSGANCTKGTDENVDAPLLLSDDTLLAAIAANPELFP